MITLNYRDQRPIYEQVTEKLRRLMMTGVLTPGDKLPSVRDLASSLAINPNTIQRAYRELEASGYIYSVPGKGSFVADSGDAGRARIEELLEVFDKTVLELRYLGIDAELLENRLRENRKGGTEE